MNELERIAVVTGGRDHLPSTNELDEMMEVLISHDIQVVRTGGARGVDGAAHIYIGRHSKMIREIWCADWRRYGSPSRLSLAASHMGRRRNVAMLTGDCSGAVFVAGFPVVTAGRPASLVIALRGNEGTWHCVEAASERGIEMHMVTR